jgi:septal ring factor EnvC (AmiA/AmiB activator)
LYGFAEESKKALVQPYEMRQLCNRAQDLEKKINKLQFETDVFIQKERILNPIIRNIYEILTRSFTILFDIQRFSNLLVLGHTDNKNDFVKCSIVIKNFAPYFKSVSAQLAKAVAEISKLKSAKKQSQDELKKTDSEYEKLCREIDTKADELANTRTEDIIQNDVVCHLATKSESLDELDAELEAENAVGVLKNSTVSTHLTLTHPVTGKIIGEFGDKGPNNEMLYYLAFETSPAAIVTSPAEGLVVFSGKFLNYGNILIISNGKYRVFLYGMDFLFASTGDIVKTGDYIGKMSADPGGSRVVKMELKESGESLDPRHWVTETMEKKESEKKQ